jgi:hypothetical protein
MNETNPLIVPQAWQGCIFEHFLAEPPRLKFCSVLSLLLSMLRVESNTDTLERLSELGWKRCF